MGGGEQPQAPPLQPGTAAPGFACTALMPDQSFAEVKLSDYRGKYVVLVFYPADFTFVCPTEIVAFSDRAEDFRKVNCELLMCSTDSHFVHLAWTNAPRGDGGLGRVAIPLLADRSQAVSRAYGVLKADEGVAYRGLFIISDHGLLRQITINDLPVGRSVDETLRLVQAFQFADKHGEVCPANWRPGQRTMKPDPQLSKEYFQAGDRSEVAAEVTPATPSSKADAAAAAAEPAAEAAEPSAMAVEAAAASPRIRMPPWADESSYKFYGFTPASSCSCWKRRN